ncbi:hypothetical protein [Pseudalkalibacillus berkeleyi]|uniref:Nucleotide modification associated domain-containing protein n=1 Tax=Pseudalkalibacillus berkeleyi TaxID=1069813 RepID=A0ABS9H0H8_9BACL|nr:hypothetical protein [Pseudalkalibacillus berkeleyi]MCF6137414.1 hypothetical protein [Pseudalkalibacillus berkeleyi]
MKIILSRKGFDSSSGGFPSPILPDGTLLSIPIPDADSNISYHDLTYGGKSYLEVINSIKGKIKVQNRWMHPQPNTSCHLDPDLQQNTLPREKGWKGLFGQGGAAQRHLDNQNVDVGDLFLFFGWFRKTVRKGNGLTFDPKDKYGKHIIYGYLQVGDVLRVDHSTTLPKWMKNHPHTTHEKRNKKGNTIYVACDSLSWDKARSGFGTFNLQEQNILTKKGMKKSCWDLPECFYGKSMSYHQPASWKEDYFQSVARGQEFVVETDEHVLNWAKDLFH